MAADGSFQRYWNARRITRRRALAGGAMGAAALGAWSLVGCSSDSKDDTPGGSFTPPADDVVLDGSQDGPGKPGGILRVRQAGALPSMNVFGPGILILAQGLTLGFTVYDHLWYVPTDTGIRENFLATEVEQPDELTVNVKIGDATFHDKAPANGRKILASDVAASFKRFREEIPIGFSWLHDVMDDIVAKDDTTLTITQKFPWAWIFTSSNAGSPIFTSILPEEMLSDEFTDQRTKDAVGSGHWILDSHDNGSNIKFRKFQNFRTFQNGKSIAGQPYLNGVDFVSILDDNQGLANFISGDIDQTGFTSRSQMEATKNDLGDKISVDEDLSRDYSCLMMRYDPPFTDIRVRQAINLLLNRDDIIEFMNDGDAQKCGPIPPAHKRYALTEDDPDLQEYFRHDIADAKKLLDAAGYDYDKEIELKHSNRPVDSKLAEILQLQLQQGGVKIKLIQEDLVKWFSQTLNQSQFQMTCFQHLAYEDPDLPLRFYMAPEGDISVTNFMKYNEPKVNTALLAAAKELDEEARVEKVKEAQRVVMKEYSPMLNIMSRISFGGRYNYIKGGINGRGSLGLFNRTTWLDDEARRAQT